MNSTERDRIELVGRAVVHPAIQVHRALGPGLLESAYQTCLALELRETGLKVNTELKLPIEYKGQRVNDGYRIDMVVENLVIVENKAVERVLPIHKAQLLTYLELSGIWLGFLLNWHSRLMKDGIHRFVSGYCSRRRVGDPGGEVARDGSPY